VLRKTVLIIILHWIVLLIIIYIYFLVNNSNNIWKMVKQYYWHVNRFVVIMLSICFNTLRYKTYIRRNDDYYPQSLLSSFHRFYMWVVSVWRRSYHEHHPWRYSSSFFTNRTYVIEKSTDQQIDRQPNEFHHIDDDEDLVFASNYGEYF
jgi:hypothetical protein